jgi:carbamate kinase
VPFRAPLSTIALVLSTRAPFSACLPLCLPTNSAETQGQIGYVLSSAVLNVPGNKGACTIVTETLVDKDDPAFANPTSARLTATLSLPCSAVSGAFR